MTAATAATATSPSAGSSNIGTTTDQTMNCLVLDQLDIVAAIEAATASAVSAAESGNGCDSDDLYGSHSSFSTASSSSITVAQLDDDDNDDDDDNSNNNCDDLDPLPLSAAMPTTTTKTKRPTSTSSSTSPPQSSGPTTNVLLPSDYQPSDADVICARGRSWWDHPGNIMYRTLIEKATKRYTETSNKLEKTLIVSEIVHAIHNRKGKFIKRKNKHCRWMEVEETFHREKIGQSLRDSATTMQLSTKYRSATSIKKQRQQRLHKINNNYNTNNTHRDKDQDDTIDRVVLSNTTVTRRMDELRYQIQQLSTSDSSSNNNGIMTNSCSVDHNHKNTLNNNGCTSMNDIGNGDNNESDGQVDSKASSCIQFGGSNYDECSMMELFSSTNSDILETIKKDTSMLNRYNEQLAMSARGGGATTPMSTSMNGGDINHINTMQGHHMFS